MIPIIYPAPSFRIKQEGSNDFIFDALRKKWLRLTPEEWVRQNFVQYLVQSLNYPASLVALEKEIRLGELKKRFDILIYDPHHQPWMIVECKAPGITLDEKVLQQGLRYNLSVPVPYIIITNGSHTYGWIKENNGLSLLQTLPGFPQ